MRRDAFSRILRGVRQRLLWVFLFWGVGASLTWAFIIPVMSFLLAPSGGHLSPSGKPIFTNPTAMLNLQVEVSVKGGIILAAPVVIFQLYRWLRPLFSRKVKQFIWWFLPLGLLSYLAGVTFAYLVLIPAGIQYLLGFGTEIATPMIDITEYMKLVTTLIIWMGVVFETPVVMLVLSKTGIVDYRRFRKIRRYMIPAIFTFGVLITPGSDPVSALLVAVPLTVLYEAGIFLAWLARPRVRA